MSHEYNKPMYKAQLIQLRKMYSARGKRTTFLIPKFLMNEVAKLRADGMKVSVTKIATTALHFALFGPHDFDNPLDGLDDAFRFYEEKNQSEREVIKSTIKHLAEMYNIDVSIK
jgi:hypothetical protein